MSVNQFLPFFPLSIEQHIPTAHQSLPARPSGLHNLFFCIEKREGVFALSTRHQIQSLAELRTISVL